MKKINKIDMQSSTLKGFNKDLLEYMNNTGELEYFAKLPRIAQLRYAATSRESIGYQRYVVEKEMAEFIKTLDLIDAIYWNIKLKFMDIKIWIQYELPKYMK